MSTWKVKLGENAYFLSFRKIIVAFLKEKKWKPEIALSLTVERFCYYIRTIWRYDYRHHQKGNVTESLWHIVYLLNSLFALVTDCERHWLTSLAWLACGDANSCINVFLMKTLCVFFFPSNEENGTNIKSTSCFLTPSICAKQIRTSK